MIAYTIGIQLQMVLCFLLLTVGNVMKQYVLACTICLFACLFLFLRTFGTLDVVVHRIFGMFCLLIRRPCGRLFTVVVCVVAWRSLVFYRVVGITSIKRKFFEFGNAVVVAVVRLLSDGSLVAIVSLDVFLLDVPIFTVSASSVIRNIQTNEFLQGISSEPSTVVSKMGER